MSTWVGQVRQWSQLETLNSRLCEGRVWLGQSGSQLYPSILAHTRGWSMFYIRIECINKYSQQVAI